MILSPTSAMQFCILPSSNASQGIILPTQFHRAVLNPEGGTRVVLASGDKGLSLTQPRFSALVGRVWSELDITQQGLLSQRLLNPRRAVDETSLLEALGASDISDFLAKERAVIELFVGKLRPLEVMAGLRSGLTLATGKHYYFIPMPTHLQTPFVTKSGQPVTREQIKQFIEYGGAHCGLTGEEALVGLNAFVSVFMLTPDELTAVSGIDLSQAKITSLLDSFERKMATMGYVRAGAQRGESIAVGVDRNQEPKAKPKQTAEQAIQGYYKLWQKTIRHLSPAERIEKAGKVTGDELLALCCDVDPGVIFVILRRQDINFRYGMVIASKHHSNMGLQAVLNRADLMRDHRVRLMLLRNPTLQEAQIGRVLISLDLQALYVMIRGHTVSTEVKRVAEEKFREKFKLRTPGEQANFILKNHGRCLNLIKGIPLVPIEAILRNRDNFSTEFNHHVQRSRFSPSFKNYVASHTQKTKS